MLSAMAARRRDPRECKQQQQQVVQPGPTPAAVSTAERGGRLSGGGPTTRMAKEWLRSGGVASFTICFSREFFRLVRSSSTAHRSTRAAVSRRMPSVRIDSDSTSGKENQGQIHACSALKGYPGCPASWPPGV